MFGKKNTPNWLLHQFEVLILLCILFFRLVVNAAYDLCTIPTPAPARLPGDGYIQAEIFGFLPPREARSICSFPAAMYSLHLVQGLLFLPQIM